MDSVTSRNCDWDDYILDTFHWIIGYLHNLILLLLKIGICKLRLIIDNHTFTIVRSGEIKSERQLILPLVLEYIQVIILIISKKLFRPLKVYSLFTEVFNDYLSCAFQNSTIAMTGLLQLVALLTNIILAIIGCRTP